MSSKLYINTAFIEHNLKNINKKLNKNTKLMAVVKANAYGLGMNETSKVLLNLGICDFAVSLVSEGVQLRKSGNNKSILVMSQFLEEDIEYILEYNLYVCISNIDLLKTLNTRALQKNKLVKIHLKIDTGMGRLGITEENFLNIIDFIQKEFKYIVIDGIYTHLSSADTDKEYTHMQLNKFNLLVDKVRNTIDFKYIHALNSAGSILYDTDPYTHVRCGILMYGYLPNNNMKNIIDVLPTLTLKAPILRIQEIKKDSKISYNGNYTATAGSKIATIQIGYADGLSRALSNQYYVKLKDKPCKIVGNICMDMCMIDISGIDEKVDIGDEVTIFETTEDIDKIAKLTNTINYEVISRIGERVKRIYI